MMRYYERLVGMTTGKVKVRWNGKQQVMLLEELIRQLEALELTYFVSTDGSKISIARTDSDDFLDLDLEAA